MPWANGEFWWDLPREPAYRESAQVRTRLRQMASRPHSRGTSKTLLIQRGNASGGGSLALLELRVAVQGAEAFVTQINGRIVAEELPNELVLIAPALGYYPNRRAPAGQNVELIADDTGNPLPRCGAVGWPDGSGPRSPGHRPKGTVTLTLSCRVPCSCPSSTASRR
jgi:hypothetical protein